MFRYQANNTPELKANPARKPMQTSAIEVGSMAGEYRLPRMESSEDGSGGQPKNRAGWFRHWWWTIVGGLVGYGVAQLNLPDWIVALGIVALTLSASGALYWREKRWMAAQRAKMAELAAESRRQNS